MKTMCDAANFSPKTALLSSNSLYFHLLKIIRLLPPWLISTSLFLSKGISSILFQKSFPATWYFHGEGFFQEQIFPVMGLGQQPYLAHFRSENHYCQGLSDFRSLYAQMCARVESLFLVKTAKLFWEAIKNILTRHKQPPLKWGGQQPC